jgi:hypothetical protein
VGGGNVEKATAGETLGSVAAWKGITKKIAFSYSFSSCRRKHYLNAAHAILID